MGQGKGRAPCRDLGPQSWKAGASVLLPVPPDQVQQDLTGISEVCSFPGIKGDREGASAPQPRAPGRPQKAAPLS